MAVELTEALLSKAAGWEAMKMARAYISQGQVLSSYWAPPLLRGVVQAGEVSFRASMVINNDVDIENLCTCREAREWGKICAHSVGVGLHWLREHQTPGPATATSKTGRSVGSDSGTATVTKLPLRKPSALRREPGGEPAELFIVLPPNFEQAVARGKIMLVLEAKWSGGRSPLNALPKGRAYAFSEQDAKIIDRLEELSNGETPALMQLNVEEFAALLPTLVEQPNVTLGKADEVTVTRPPIKMRLRATLETNGEILLSSPKSNEPLVFVGNWVWQKGTLQPLGLPDVLKDILRGPVRVTRAQVPEFLSRHWPQLQVNGGIEANFELNDFTLEPQTPQFLLELKGGLAQLRALLQCRYGSRIMTVGVTGPDEHVWLPDPQNITRYSTRDLAAERAALGRLQRSGFSGPDSQGSLQLLGQDAVLNFFAREYSKLERE